MSEKDRSTSAPPVGLQKGTPMPPYEYQKPQQRGSDTRLQPASQGAPDKPTKMPAGLRNLKFT